MDAPATTTTQAPRKNSDKLYQEPWPPAASKPAAPSSARPAASARPPATKPHCTTCGHELPGHRTDCKFYKPPAPTPHPAPVANNEPRITWSMAASNIKAIHLIGKPRTLTIKNCEARDGYLADGKKKSYVLTFVETSQVVYLNGGCMDSLFLAYGDDAKNCIGKRVTIYAAPWGKKHKLAIRTEADEPPIF